MSALGTVRSWLQTLPVVARDALFAAVVAAVDVSLLWLHDPVLVEGYTGPSPTAAAVVLLLATPLAWRRVAPHAVVAATLAGTVVAVVGHVPTQLIAPIVALYTVAAYRPRRQSLPWLAGAALLAVVLTAYIAVFEALPGQLVIVVTAWLFGDRTRVLRERDTILREQAARLERERERAASLAASEERAAVARELHDVLAHSVSLMVVQAAAARRVLLRDPSGAGQAVAQLVATGEESLAELHRMVGVLDEGSGGPAPQPGLDDLPGLVQGFRDAGVPITLEVRGAPRPLHPDVELTAYRIAQESLTNVLKHAGGEATATVTLTYGEGGVALDVVDDGAGGGAGTSGHGVAGMRERAAMLGGRIDAAPRAAGGFRVHADLPAGGHES